MQYQVPQFIDIEDKIIGPLTIRQFFYLLGGAAIIFIMYIFLQLWVVIILGIPVAAFSLALAFLKIDGVPFIKVIANAINFTSSKRLYLWKKSPAESLPEANIQAGRPTTVPAPKLSERKLQDLAWSLDVQKITKR